ncbi:MAG: winged helix-turn-helix transcriptional regulator [Bacteroidetes bacterium]|nr:winged helix-turn-helix transcriptional regulator [Bacteroidota bacterium]
MEKSLCQSLPFGRSLAILTKSYYAALSKRLEHLEIARYYSVLILIDNQQGQGCTQQFLCDQLKIDKVSMVRIIQYLIEKNFILKVVNPADRRANLVALTPKAIQSMPQIYHAIDEVNEAALKGLSSSGRQALMNQLSRIQENLDRLPADLIFINYKKSSKKP